MKKIVAYIHEWDSNSRLTEIKFYSKKEWMERLKELEELKKYKRARGVRLRYGILGEINVNKKDLLFIMVREIPGTDKLEISSIHLKEKGKRYSKNAIIDEYIKVIEQMDKYSLYRFFDNNFTEMGILSKDEIYLDSQKKVGYCCLLSGSILEEAVKRYNSPQKKRRRTYKGNFMGNEIIR